MGLVEQQVEAYLIREFEEKQQRQLEGMLKNLGHQATNTRVFLRKTSAGFALELSVQQPPSPSPQFGGSSTMMRQTGLRTGGQQRPPWSTTTAGFDDDEEEGSGEGGTRGRMRGSFGPGETMLGDEGLHFMTRHMTLKDIGEGEGLREEDEDDD